MFAKNYNTDWEEQQRVLRVKLQIEPRNLHSQQRLTFRALIFRHSQYPDCSPIQVPSERWVKKRRESIDGGGGESGNRRKLSKKIYIIYNINYNI